MEDVLNSLNRYIANWVCFHMHLNSNLWSQRLMITVSSKTTWFTQNHARKVYIEKQKNPSWNLIDLQRNNSSTPYIIPSNRQERGILNSVCGIRFILLPKQSKNTFIGQSQWWTKPQNFLNNVLAKQTQQHIKKNYSPWSNLKISRVTTML